ncbi:MAG: NADH-quinone oxidoreductase subunit H [Thermoplasmata archaeon]|nr:MAG: NADH-quinone oxidoreductase subunit H [Thermoplasmata archaeon]RLF50699.1 MAG: NADH-quinone oxidoreductase subunit H [Thermoplasmata archaeon]
MIEVIDQLFKAVFGAIVIGVFAIIIALLYKGIDRKIAARMQSRVGPPVRQPFRDVIKLFLKENVVPRHATKWLFNLSPVIALASSMTILLYLPMGSFGPILSTEGDLILILYLLIIPSLAMVLGGFASGSPYATVGAQREMVLMMSLEFPLAVVIVSLAWRLKEVGVSNPFSLVSISSNPIWNNVGVVGIVGCSILLLVLLLITPGELSKIPFDVPEAETEIAGGLLAEYSGRNLAMFYLTDAVKTIVVASLIVTLFFPYNLSPFFSLSGITAYIVDFLFYLFKLFLVILFAVTMVRVGVARLKIDQVTSVYWINLTLLALIGLVLLMFDKILIMKGISIF